LQVPGSLQFFVTSSRDVLAGQNKGNEHKLGDWGFEVIASPAMTPEKSRESQNGGLRNTC
jgi:hypothetical protein